jgi:hypothetical protein
VAAAVHDSSDSASDPVLDAEDFGPKELMKPGAPTEGSYINPKLYACQLYPSVAAI